MVIELEAVKCVERLFGTPPGRRFQPGTRFVHVGWKCLDRSSSAKTSSQLALDTGPEALLGLLRHAIELDGLEEQVAIAVCLQEVLRFLDRINQIGRAAAGNGAQDRQELLQACARAAVGNGAHNRQELLQACVSEVEVAADRVEPSLAVRRFAPE